MTTTSKSRKDLLLGVQNIASYIPGDPSTQRMALMTSSGTAGNPTMLVVQDTEDSSLLELRYGFFRHFCRVFARRQVGVNNVLSLLRSDHSGRRLLYLEQDDFTDGTDIHRTLEEFQPDTVAGGATAVRILIDKIVAQLGNSMLPKSITKISLSSEIPELSIVQRLRSLFPAISIVARYNLSESLNTIGTSCPYIFNKYYDTKLCTIVHPYVRTEIHNLNEAGYGEIVISTPEMPTYKTGDYGSLITEKCPCGKDVVLFVYAREDRVHCEGATFVLSLIEQVLERLHLHIKDFEFEVHAPTDRKPHIKLITIPTETAHSSPEANAFISTYLNTHLYVTKTRTLGELITAGIFANTEVLFESDFPPQSKKRRLRKCFD